MVCICMSSDIMMDISLALLDTIQKQVLSLNLDGMQSGFKALLNAVDPITVVNRAMLIREETMREKRYALDGVNILKVPNLCRRGLYLNEK